MAESGRFPPPENSRRLLMAIIVLGLLGVLTVALAPFEAIVPPGVDIEALRWLALVQPAVLMVLTAVLSHASAHRVSLDAPLLRALVSRGNPVLILTRQLPAAALGALAAGAVLAIYGALTAGAIETEFLTPVAMRLLYGGITEEVLARWGVMSFATWASWRLGGRLRPVDARHYWIGNAIAAVLFSLGHLPLLFTLGGDTVTPWLIAAVMAANMVPALIFGWLYWQRGLEAAMIAHGGAHVVALGAARVIPL